MCGFHCFSECRFIDFKTLFECLTFILIPLTLRMALKLLLTDYSSLSILLLNYSKRHASIMFSCHLNLAQMGSNYLL